MSIIEELGVKVTTNIDTSELESLNGICPEYDEIINSIINTLKSDEPRVTEAVAESLSNNMTIIIAQQSYLTGRMAESTVVEQSGNTADVGVTALSDEGFPYPLVIEFGRAEIYKSDGVLHWIQNGMSVFSHRSGAVAPRPFVEKSIMETLDNVEPLVCSVLSVLD